MRIVAPILKQTEVDRKGHIPTLRARPKYQLSSDILLVEDYMQQNRLDYTQQNRDWAALKSFKSNLCVLIVKKVVL